MSDSKELAVIDGGDPRDAHEAKAAQAVAEPFGRGMRGGAVNEGAVTIEIERAIAEAQGQLMLAKKFPRSMTQAHVEFMEACKSLAFAQTAFYKVPNRGTGPSIRFAEEVARCYGNFEYGHRELSREDGKSEIEVFAWDKERNNYSKRQITVLHILDAQSGPRKLRDQADIDNRIANVAAKQMRGRILALVPKSLVAFGIAECQKTIAGGAANGKPLPQRIADMATAFGGLGVQIVHIESYLGHKVDASTAEELVDLLGIYTAIKEGAKPSEYFKLTADGEGAKPSESGAAAAIVAKATETGKPATDKKPETVKEKDKPKGADAAKATDKAKAADPKPDAAKKADATPPADKAKEPEKPAETKESLF